MQPSFSISDTNVHDIVEILESGNWVGHYKYYDELSKIMSDMTGVKYIVPCANCTQAMIILLQMCGLRDGSLIATPAFTWSSINIAAQYSGSKIVYCDIDPDTWHMDLNSIIEHNLYEYIKVIVPVDIFGSNFVTYTNKVRIIDAAHSFGTKLLGKRAPTEVVSFSYTKPVTGMQGGVVLTNNAEIYSETVKMVDLSAKMCEINAYIILRNIERFSETQAKRMSIINIYRKNLNGNVPYVEQKIPFDTNYSVYGIVIKDYDMAEKIRKQLDLSDIEYKQYYKPLVSGLKNTDDLYKRIICLPVYHGMEDNIDYTCETIIGAIQCK